MDRHTPEQRSFNMSQVKSKNTKPELIIFSLLEEAGIKFEKHYAVAGKPDVAFPEYKVAVFIDGEFWHGKSFNRLKETLTPFWVKKIGDNVKRDRRNIRKLRAEGWHVLHFWDKKVVRYPQKALKRIIRFLERAEILAGK